MSSSVKLAFQYIVSLGLGVLLIWYALRDQDINQIFDTLSKADPIYIIISTVLLTISHISRAIRWKILYKPLNYNPSFKNSFLALMSGYFMNQLIPRLGEVTRCGVLQKVEKIPLPISFGTVIAERLMDLVMLLLLFVFTFYIEFERLNNFFIDILNKRFQALNDFSAFFYAFAVVMVISGIAGFILYSRFKEKIHNNKIFSKVLGLVKNIIEGIISIRKIKERKAFIFHTLVIWAMYYGASFVVVYSLPQTSELSFLAGFSILLMGSLAMTAPVQGGIGAFELLVSAVLVLYGISEKDGMSFALLVHSSQYLFTFISGGLCFLATFYVNKKKEIATYEYSSQNS